MTCLLTRNSESGNMSKKSELKITQQKRKLRLDFDASSEFNSETCPRTRNLGSSDKIRMPMLDFDAKNSELGFTWQKKRKLRLDFDASYELDSELRNMSRNSELGITWQDELEARLWYDFWILSSCWTWRWDWWIELWYEFRVLTWRTDRTGLDWTEVR